MRNFLAFAAAVGVCSSASAQVYSAGADTGNWTDTTGVSSSFFESNGPPTDTGTTTSYTSQLLQDSVLTFDRSNGSLSDQFLTIVPLEVGSFPVDFRGISISVNQSWIITGGGKATIDPYVNVTWREQLGSTPNLSTDPIVALDTDNFNPISGNGRYGMNGTLSTTGSLFLTPGYYYMAYTFGFTGSLEGFEDNANPLTAGLTIEGGGPHTSGTLNGLTAQVDFEPAPEPSAALVLGAALVPLLLRRRK